MPYLGVEHLRHHERVGGTDRLATLDRLWRDHVSNGSDDRVLLTDGVLDCLHYGVEHRHRDPIDLLVRITCDQRLKRADQILDSRFRLVRIPGHAQLALAGRSVEDR